MTLTDEQSYVVNQILQGLDHDQVQTLSGYAGTGKSFCVTYLSAQLPTFGICTFTGKAADVLRRRGVQAHTIHSTIYYPWEDPETGEVRWKLKPAAKLCYDGFIIDEASMVSKHLWDDLTSFGLPIIAVGDAGQLPPVGQDIHLMKRPMYSLETVHRNAGEIAFFAEHLRKGNKPYTFKTAGAVTLVKKTNDDLPTTTQVICAYNRTRVAVNKKVRKRLGYRKLLHEGERIICLQNNRTLRLFNGMQGIVTRVNLKSHRLDFQAGETNLNNIEYDPEVFNQEKPVVEYRPQGAQFFDYAYAVTCHKAQGDEWDDVTVIEEMCPLWEHDRWTYTAASRARKALTWVGATTKVLARAG